MDTMKGFDLRLERGRGLRVNCGDEPMKACLDAAMPLLDRLDTMPPPPPPGAMPPAPPRP